jgi:hypothetical protein
MEMIVIPNSCFTVIFLDSRYHKIDLVDSLSITDPVSHIDVLIKGQWMPMSIFLNGFHDKDAYFYVNDKAKPIQADL